MNLLDLYEGREPYQQAIDKLEQRRIADLEARMDDCARRGDVAGFRKAKEERDSYHKVKTNEGQMKRAMHADAERMSREAFCKKYGDEDWVGEFWDNVSGPLDEAGIGQDIVNKTEKMARATPPTRAGAVASTVKNAAKWLAGKGGPGKEGPTYESAQKKNSKKVNEDSKPRDLAAAVMLKKAHAAFPLAKDDAEALALWIAEKEQRDVNRLEKENEQEEAMIARIIDQLQKKDLDEHGGGGGGPREWHAYVRSHRADEGWSDAIVAQRTGRPRTPYSVFIKGRKWKDFENEDHAENVANKLRAKFKAEGRDPGVITIAPTDYDVKEAISKKDLLGKVTKDANKDFKKAKAGKLKTNGVDFTKGDHWQGPGPDDYGYTGYQGHGMPTDKAERARIRADKKKGVAEGATVAYVVTYINPKTDDRGETTVSAMSKEDAMTKVKQQLKQKGYTVAISGVRRAEAVDEEKTRLDPKCWKGKKIGNPKTKMKGGVRVNNCVPAESVEEEAKKGLYYYVNKRKKAGTSRDKDDPRAPSAQDWKDAAKTAKKESVEEEWSEKYKRSINCSNPKGFSQKAHCAGRKKNEGMFSTLEENNEARDAVESAIIRRILVAHKDLLQKFGPQKVMDAASAVADDHADVEEIGTSDVSAYVHEVERYLAMNY